MDSLDTLPTAQTPITTADAYRAMLQVLEYYFRLGENYPLASVLGDLAPGSWLDGAPGDPASWSRWLQAVQGKLVQPAQGSIGA
jgi:hypothetical protein